MLRLCFRTVSNNVWPATDKCVGWDRDNVEEPGTVGSFMDRLQAGGKVLYEQTVCLFDESTMHRLAANNPVATTEARRPPPPLPPPPSPPHSSLRRACPRTGAGENRGGGGARASWWDGGWLLLSYY
jgi:hypothetical protein